MDKAIKYCSDAVIALGIVADGLKLYFECAIEKGA